MYRSQTMKDESFWIVVKDGEPLSSGIRCEGGKDEAKEVRKKLTSAGGSWKAQKTTQREIDATRSLQTA